MAPRLRISWLWFAAATPPVLLLSFVLAPPGSDPLALFRPDHREVLALRAWRVVQGAAVGGSLAAAGAVLQAVLRNPLADPYVLGLSAGSGLAVGLAAALGLAVAAPWMQPAAAFVGALLSLAVVVRLARGAARRSPPTLILAGVGWSALCASLLMFMVSRLSAEGLHSLTWWFLGDLEPYDPRLTVWVLAVQAAALAAILLRSRWLNVLSLGDETAQHLGLAPERARLVLLALAAALAASSVAAAGIIGFVGLVVPHLCRGWVGADHRRLLPATFLFGACALCLADAVGRTVLYPSQVPAGVITALAGAPFFLSQLRRREGDLWTG